MPIISYTLDRMALPQIKKVSELSTQQAADRLHVSRPHFVKLLENNEIPFKKVGSHRRVLLSDLITYEKKQQRVREEQLQFLSDQDQELNLGYE